MDTKTNDQVEERDTKLESGDQNSTDTEPVLPKAKRGIFFVSTCILYTLILPFP